MADKSHVIDLEPLDMDNSLSDEERPVKCFDSKVRSTQIEPFRLLKSYGKIRSPSKLLGRQKNQ